MEKQTLLIKNGTLVDSKKFYDSDILIENGIIKKGTITHNGVLTEKFKYLEDFVS